MTAHNQPEEPRAVESADECQRCWHTREKHRSGYCIARGTNNYWCRCREFEEAVHRTDRRRGAMSSEQFPFPENHHPDHIRPNFCAVCGTDWPCDIADLAADLVAARRDCERLRETLRFVDDRWRVLSGGEPPYRDGWVEEVIQSSPPAIRSQRRGEMSDE